MCIRDRITQARQHAELSFTGPFPSYIVSTIEDHAEKSPNSYDAVVASEVVEHVTNKQSFVKSCITALKVCILASQTSFYLYFYILPIPSL